MLRSIFLCLCIIMLLAINSAIAADMPIQVIDLKYKTAQEVIPVLQPFVTAGGTVTGMNNQLIIKTDPSNFVQLQKILDEVDKIPQQLIISIKQGNQQNAHDTRQRSGVYLSNRQGKDKSHIFVGQRQIIANAQADHIQQIKVLEGQKAFIQTGTAIPLDSETVDGNQTTQYHNVTTGFYIVPRITGNGREVMLEVLPFDKALNQDDSIRVSEAQTQIAVTPGQWVELAGMTSQVHQSDDDHNISGVENNRIWVKVEIP